jgi:uncharacterized protein
LKNGIFGRSKKKAMETVQTIKSQLKGFWEDKPIRKAYLFGSAVREELTAQSDIDILVELDSTKLIGMIEYIKIMEALEKLLGRNVDLVATDGLSPYIKPIIDKEKMLIYEA